MRLEVLSPLHIGNGNRLTPVDIYPSEDRVYVLDVEKLFNDLQKLGVDIEEILTLLKSPPGEHYVWKGYIEEYSLNPSDYALYSLPVFGEPGKTSMQINEFIKSSGRPYIPGSSIKGAIRTAVFYKALKDCGDSGTAMNLVANFSPNLAREIGYSESLIDYYVDYLNRETAEKRKFDDRRADDLLEAIVFGMEGSKVHYEPKRDPMRALIIRDSPAIGRKHLAVYRVEAVGNPSPIPVWVEALQPGTEIEVELSFDEELLRVNSSYFNGLLWECLKDRGKPWEVFEDFVWEAVKEFYNSIVEHELRSLSKFGSRRESVRSFYGSIKGKEKILRLGWGSGWISTTIGLLLVERGGKWEHVRRKLGLGRNPSGRGFSKDFPKTRRLAEGKPMGWVVLK
ncbi:type III-A CRISPR-associated RAMP protein Csm5 [Thermococcus waiotapuensis]|uniref:CRISPR system Cms protein Csm5 n=1 Tax=Thermococcus waiotapuensis TaxID=90909 RepID=A0AAE4T246_9EURY|nr:type III-A CRISPR-associated RAMP protein Csm5 [Thermococcus waiotapuensis]MDV3103747.1 type III-A CRISPR-associated RAMP protein Csm5 [Thermococcus waiotapuensis]